MAPAAGHSPLRASCLEILMKGRSASSHVLIQADDLRLSSRSGPATNNRRRSPRPNRRSAAGGRFLLLALSDVRLPRRGAKYASRSCRYGVVFARYAGAMVVALLALRPWRELPLYLTRRPLLQLAKPAPHPVDVSTFWRSRTCSCRDHTIAFAAPSRRRSPALSSASGSDRGAGQRSRSLHRRRHPPARPEASSRLLLSIVRCSATASICPHPRLAPTIRRKACSSFRDCRDHPDGAWRSRAVWRPACSSDPASAIGLLGASGIGS